MFLFFYGYIALLYLSMILFSFRLIWFNFVYIHRIATFVSYMLPFPSLLQVVHCYVHLPGTQHSHVTKVMWPFCAHLEATAVLHRPSMMRVTKVWISELIPYSHSIVT